jgi:hypothetical protein
VFSNPPSRQTVQVPLPRLRSPFARAVVPVLGGLFVLAAIALVTWAMAAVISSGTTQTSDRLAPTRIPLGSVVSRAADVEREGPLLFPGLNTARGERSLVLYHRGPEPETGWVVYAAHPADRPADCAVEQIRGSRSFIDCEGREIDVTDLAPPDLGIFPVVENRESLYLDLSGLASN